MRPVPVRPQRIKAALAMIGASALLAVTTLLAKALGPAGGANALHPLQVSAGRFVFAFCAIALVAAWLRPSLAGTPWRLHAVRSALGWLGVTFMFAAAALMPLAEATAISFLNPVAAMVLAVLLLREEVSRARWMAAGIALVGALLLIRPGFAAFQPVALIALASAAFTGAELIVIKRLSGREPMLRILLVNNAIGALIAGTVAVLVWTMPTAAQWAMLAVLGVTMVCAQALVIGGMQRADASFVTPFFYATLLFAAFYDLAVFGERPDLLAVAGALIIVVGAVALTLADRDRPTAVPASGAATSAARKAASST